MTTKVKNNGSSQEVEEKVIDLVFDSLNKLALLKRILNDDDLLELKGYELEGAKQTVEEVFNLLDAALALHTRTH